MPPSCLSILIAAGIFPPDHGGPATYVPAIAQGLMEGGHRIVAVVTLADDPVAAASRAWPFPVVRLRRRQNRLIRMVATVARLTALVRQVDVVFANSLVTEPVLATALTRKPLVIKVVGDPVWEHAHQSGPRLDLETFQTARLPPAWHCWRRLNALAHRRAIRVIVPSTYLARIVAGWGVAREHIRVVRNAAVLRPPLEPPPATSYDIVTVCRLVPWKGVARLIRFAAAANRSLLVVGDGPERERLESTTRESGARVDFTGTRPSSEIPTLIAAARVFALASDYEGMPHAALEAMAAGIPVVAFASGGTIEMVRDGETGLLVPPGDEAALAAAITRLLDDPTLRQKLAANARCSLVRFTPDIMVAETEAVLREAVVSR